MAYATSACSSARRLRGARAIVAIAMLIIITSCIYIMAKEATWQSIYTHLHMHETSCHWIWCRWYACLMHNIQHGAYRCLLIISEEGGVSPRPQYSPSSLCGSQVPVGLLTYELYCSWSNLRNIPTQQAGVGFGVTWPCAGLLYT
jgi:hypothetical protein